MNQYYSSLYVTKPRIWIHLPFFFYIQGFSSTLFFQLNLLNWIPAMYELKYKTKGSNNGRCVLSGVDLYSLIIAILVQWCFVYDIYKILLQAHLWKTSIFLQFEVFNLHVSDTYVAIWKIKIYSTMSLSVFKSVYIYFWLLLFCRVLEAYGLIELASFVLWQGNI